MFSSCQILYNDNYRRLCVHKRKRPDFRESKMKEVTLNVIPIVGQLHSAIFIGVVAHLLNSAMSSLCSPCFCPPASCTRKEKLGILESTGSQGLGPHEWQARHTGFSGSIVSKGWILRWASPSIVVFCCHC